MDYYPAAGFDPLTASDDQLLANDYPPRPTDQASLTTWLHYVTAPIARTSACADLGVAAGTAQSRVAGNWAGDVATGHAYTSVYASWTLPTATSRAPGGQYSYSSDWVGLNSGFSASAPLLQMGSGSNAGEGLHNYGLWVEAYPILPKRNLVGTQVHPGDRLFMHVYANRSRVWFHMVDETAGFNHTYVFNHRLPLNPTAEWILERPGINSGISILAASSVRFRNSQAAGYGFWHRPVGRLPHFNYRMYSCDGRVLLARARPVSRNGKDFTVSFLNSGGGANDVGCR